MPSEAHLIKDGQMVDVKVETLKQETESWSSLVRKYPLIAVIEGETSVNESMLTGESKPVMKKIEDNVIGGSINSEGSISMDVRKIGSETYFNPIMPLAGSQLFL